MRKINKIVLHHSASPAKTTTLKMITQWHLKRGFRDVGYHYFIDYQGEIWKGRPEKEVGAHCRGHNTDSIGICLAGNFPFEKPTKRQGASLKHLVESILFRYDLYKKDVFLHKDLGNTKCPGVYLLAWLS